MMDNNGILADDKCNIIISYIISYIISVAQCVAFVRHLLGGKVRRYSENINSNDLKTPFSITSCVVPLLVWTPGTRSATVQDSVALQ